MKFLASCFAFSIFGCNYAASEQTAGAVQPFRTYEAESPEFVTTGVIVSLTGAPQDEIDTPELEASGRAYVELVQEGQYLQMQVAENANTLVLRHCIPDAEAGGGISATLGLYVNGEFRQELPLESRYNWLYGGADGRWGNDPSTGAARVFWDETRFKIDGEPLRPGDTLRLQKRPQDTAAYYRIDLLDLEEAPAPLNPPADGTWLSISDFGAGNGDATADTAAIKACIAAARSQGKTVWMPAGTYYQNEQFVLDGVKVQGAGIWHTSLIGTLDTSHRDFGFRLAGDGAQVRDLFLENAAVSRRGSGSKAFTSSNSDRPSNWLVENVWIAHSHVGFWMGGAMDGVVRNCRVRFTYADAINLSSGASRNLVENNHVRGCGDDGIVVLAERSGGTHTGLKGDTYSRDNTFRRNSVIAIYHGHNADLAGGTGHVFEYNYLADNSSMGAFTINHPVPFPMHDLTDSVVRGNVIVRGGGLHNGQRRGALWVFTGVGAANNVLLEDNLIVDALFRGIHLTGSAEQNLIFRNNRIINPGMEGILIEGKVNGSGEFIGNEVVGAAVPFRNDATEAYTVIAEGNSW